MDTISSKQSSSRDQLLLASLKGSKNDNPSQADGAMLPPPSVTDKGSKKSSVKKKKDPGEDFVQ